jgi:hypothetical protein
LVQFLNRLYLHVAAAWTEDALTDVINRPPQKL